MTQVRYTTFKANVDSYTNLQRFLGILQPGRYRGYDVLADIATWNFNIDHTITHIVKSTSATPPVTGNNMSMLYTPQGIVVEEDAKITGLVATAADGTNDRIDLVVCDHEYLASTGGQLATYSLIDGTPASSPVPPSLANPEKQTIVGELRTIGGSSSLSTAIWTPARVPGLGDKAGVYLDQSNIFTEIQTISESAGLTIASNAIDMGAFQVAEITSGSGPLHFIKEKPKGTTIYLNTAGINVVHNKATPPADHDAITTLLAFDMTLAGASTWIKLKSGGPGSNWIIVDCACGGVQSEFDPDTGSSLEVTLKTKIIEIGDWDMDADATSNVAHNITDFKKIRNVEVWIRIDSDVSASPLDREGKVTAIDSTNIQLARDASGVFDSVNYDSTSFNRGWITIRYETH